MQSWPKLKETQGKKMQTHPDRLVPLIYHKSPFFEKKYYNTYSILLFSNSWKTILLIETLYTKVYQI